MNARCGSFPVLRILIHSLAGVGKCLAGSQAQPMAEEAEMRHVTCDMHVGLNPPHPRDVSLALRPSRLVHFVVFVLELLNIKFKHVLWGVSVNQFQN